MSFVVRWSSDVSHFETGFIGSVISICTCFHVLTPLFIHSVNQYLQYVNVKNEFVCYVIIFPHSNSVCYRVI